MSDADKSKKTVDNLGLDLSQLIERLDVDKIADNADKQAQRPASSRRFDPNSTVAYSEAGESYPDLPFADTMAGLGNPSGDDATTKPRSRKMSSRRQTPRGQAAKSKSATAKSRTGSLGQRVTTSSLPRTPEPQYENDTARSPQKTTGSRVRRVGSHASSNEGLQGAFKPVDINHQSYSIRGAGAARQRSPLVMVLVGVLVVVALVSAGTFLYNLVGIMAGGGGGGSVTLSASQTRQAIDSRLPILTAIIDYSLDETVSELRASGQQLFVNSRYQPESPDTTAEGQEIVSMPNTMTDEQMQGYYEGSYSAYSLTELEQDFNGAYTLDLARGELGNWNKLRYVNLNATSIDDEITRLLALQGLIGMGAEVSEKGTDTRGNKVVQGTLTLDERVYYYKVAACQFSEVYKASKIADNSVYATCTVATYDFYTGADTITP